MTGPSFGVCLIASVPPPLHGFTDAAQLLLRAKGWSELLHAAERVCDTHPRVQVEYYGAPTTDSPPDAIAVLEAMQSGLPVIATKVGAIPEVVIDGLGGTLVDVGDVGGLAEAIAYVADHPDERRRMGMLNRTRFLTTFHLDRVADQWVALLRGL